MSYSCLPNIGDIINMHHKATPQQIDRKTETVKKLCNCRDPSACPLAGRFKEDLLCTRQLSHRWYTTEAVRPNSKADTTTSKASGLKKKKHATELSKVVSNVKFAETPLIKSCIVKRVPPDQCGSRKCQPCLAEKMIILQTNKKSLLNERSELMSKCRHVNKFSLNNVRSKT